MSIYGVCGLPRSGKSTTFLEMIIKELKRKNPRPVHTNLPINLARLELIHEVDASLITLYDGKDGRPGDQEFANTFAEVEGQITLENHPGKIHDGCLVLFDEVHLLFPIGSKDNPNGVGMTHWVSMHGHYGVDMYWASQAHESVQVDIRRRTEAYIYCESNQRKVGGKGTYQRKLLGKNVKTHEPEYGFAYKDERCQIKPEIYTCYQSFDIAGSGETEQNGFHLPPFVKKYGIIIGIGIVTMLAAGSFVAWKLVNVMDQLAPKKSIAKTQDKVKVGAEKKQNIQGVKNVSEFVTTGDSVEVDGTVCAGTNCDLYVQGSWVGSYIVKDTARPTNIHRVAN